jgi:2-phospho-L-lactate guanylyltransferase
MNWTAIVPVNYGRDCKTRLAQCLSSAERTELVAAMARHVLGQLAALPAISHVAVLSPERPPFAPDGWIADGGRGLNAELAAGRAHFPGAATLIIHADLPLLRAEDITALLDAAMTSGAAIAPDLAGTGTNAVALADGRPFAPAFGPGSFAAHKAAMPDAAIIAREGLGFDVDEPDSLRRAVARGLVGPFETPIAPPI